MSAWVYEDGKLVEKEDLMTWDQDNETYAEFVERQRYMFNAPLLDLKNGFIKVFTAWEDNQSGYAYYVCVSDLVEPIEHILVDFDGLLTLLKDLDILIRLVDRSGQEKQERAHKRKAEIQHRMINRHTPSVIM